ncbi:MAG: TonB-dependent receptor [Pseudomonadota bacterium]
MSRSTKLLSGTAMMLLWPLAAMAQDNDQEPFDLGTLVLEWENLGRPLDETSAANTVVGEEVLRLPGNSNVLDAARNTPNVLVETGPLLPSIRGIDGTAGVFGSTAFGAGSNPRVNVVVDGVSRIPAAIGSVGQLASTWDVQRVEVARGPQTTLGGRSSLAGAFNIVTNDPVFDSETAFRFSAKVREGESVFGAALMLNRAVSDSVALRFTLEGEYGDSFTNVVDPAVTAFRDEIEDIQNSTIRLKALVAPQSVPGLEIVFGYERETRDQLNANEVDLGGQGFDLSDFINNNSEDRVTQDIFSIRSRYEISDALTFEGRLSYTDALFEIPNSNESFDLTQDFQNQQAEFLLRYEGTGFFRRGVIGVAYESQEEVGRNSTLATAAFGFDFDVDGEFTNRSVFGEAEFALTNQLFGFVGGRLESQDIARTVNADFGFGPVNATVDTDDTQFSPRVGLRYEFSENASIGYQYSEGFRPGGIDIDLFTGGVATFDGETLKQHEIWTRYADPAGRFELNGSVFAYKLDNAQVTGAGPGFLIGNVPEAEGYGLEVDGEFYLSERSTFRFGLGLLDTNVSDAGTNPNAIGLQGTRLPNSASVTLSLGYTYVAQNGWDFGADILHVGDRTSPFGGGDPVPDYTTVNVRAGYTADVNGVPLRIDAYINNLFDERIVINRDTAFGLVDEVGAPRTIGISATVRF